MLCTFLALELSLRIHWLRILYCLHMQLRVCSLASFGAGGTTETVNDDFSTTSVPAGHILQSYIPVLRFLMCVFLSVCVCQHASVCVCVSMHLSVSASACICLWSASACICILDVPVYLCTRMCNSNVVLYAIHSSSALLLWYLLSVNLVPAYASALKEQQVAVVCQTMLLLPDC